MDNRIALTARLRELEATARTAAQHREAELSRAYRLDAMASEARGEAADYADEVRAAERNSAIIRAALLVCPASMDAELSHLSRLIGLVIPASDALPPSDADPATGIPYGDLT